LHRAVSVFALEGSGALIIQQRALSKYHSAGLWSNAACTHPREGESVIQAAERCLREELGVSAVLEPAFRFRYRAPVPPGLIEHEFDHVFVGTVRGSPQPRAEEVMGWRAMSPNALALEMTQRPEAFTAWFRIALPLYRRWRERNGEQLHNPFFETV
jgi:isopentenyl-diphosphate delta-isomerase